MGLSDFIKLQTPAASIDYYEMIARGLIPGARPVAAYGKATAGAATPTKLLWANGTWTAPPEAGARIRIVSSSIQDAQGGTGIRSLHVHFLDENLEDRVEIVVLNGTNPVIMKYPKVRFIQCAHMDTFGSTKAAVGTIQFQNADNITLIYNEIDPLEVRCTSSARMVPKGKRIVVTGGVVSSVSGTASAGAIFSLASSFFEDHDYIKSNILIPLASFGLQDGSDVVTLKPPLVFGEGVVIGILFLTDKAATVTGTWFGVLETV